MGVSHSTIAHSVMDLPLFWNLPSSTHLETYSPGTRSETTIMLMDLDFDNYVLFQKYVEAGRPYKDQKNFQNVVNPPLITGPVDTVLLDKLNCPGLHILLGTNLF